MKIIDYLKYLDYCVVLPIAAKLPVQWAYKIGNLRGRLLRKSREDSRRHAEENVAEIFPEMSPAEVESLVLRNFQMKARDELEAFWYSRPLEFFDGFVDVTGLNELRRALEKKKGVLFFSGHMGSLGLCWCVVGKNGISLTIVARSLEPHENPLHPVAREYNRRKVAWIEESIGEPFLLTRRGNYHRTREKLNNGEVVMIAVDVLPDILNSKYTVTVNLFETPAILANGIASLYKETEAQLVQWSIHRDNKTGRQKIELRDVTDQVDRSATPQQIVQILANLLEDKIRQHPAHWHVWDSVKHYRKK